MKLLKTIARSAALCAALCAPLISAGQSSFEAGKGTFLLNGEPFVVKAAELHYPRIPKPYWDNRIKLCKALGMNTICLYVFWNAHEPNPGKFDFQGQNDLAEFVKLCAENDMKVILRPGPYVCAEWEMGGLPWWLVKDKDMRLREDDPRFLERVKIFEEAVAKEVGDLTIDKGGPIIMVQVENEYGSYGVNKPYVAAIRDVVRANYPGVELFQCDWSSNFERNGLDDLIWTMNFGTGSDIDAQFARLKELRPESPLMCSEFWSGWFDKWGANHETRPAEEMIEGIDDMLGKGISFSLYMTHGGTNWGHWAGANSPGFAPDVTSYDYDAPISESGQTTPKYYALRETMARHNGGVALPDVPPTIPSGTVKAFELTEVAPLWANIPTTIRTEDVQNMETFGQGFGSMVYSTTLPKINKGTRLVITEPHDYVQVFIDGNKIGTIDRRLGQKEISIPETKSGSRLDLLVEAMGRINFGRAIKDFKGITDRVDLIEGPDTIELKGWETALLPDSLEFYERMTFEPVANHSDLPAGVYRGKFSVEKPTDTFLDFSTWGKGLVYVNGHPLGRIWEIGPQQTLYMPGCWLKEGENEILVFDIVGPASTHVEGLAEPLLDSLKPERRIQTGEIDLSGKEEAASMKLSGDKGWQKAKFSNPAKGRYLAIETTGEGGVAEIILSDASAKAYLREEWSPVAADSEDQTGNHTLDKAFDLQESTWWAPADSQEITHKLVIDLGQECEISEATILPRISKNEDLELKIFISSDPFVKAQ